MENLVGTDGYDDVLTGNSHANAIYGSGGSDTILGGKGNDFLYGDQTYGPLFAQPYPNNVARTAFMRPTMEAATDTLKGGSGSDLFDGGVGPDTLRGGAGNDTFVLEKESDSGVGAGNRDTADFADGDKFDLHAIDADTTVDGNQDFHLGSDAFTNTPGELIQFVESGHIIVAADTNGDGIAEFEIQLTSPTTLVDGDFVF